MVISNFLQPDVSNYNQICEKAEAPSNWSVGRDFWYTYTLIALLRSVDPVFRFFASFWFYHEKYLLLGHGHLLLLDCIMSCLSKVKDFQVRFHGFDSILRLWEWNRESHRFRNVRNIVEYHYNLVETCLRAFLSIYLCFSSKNPTKIQNVSVSSKANVHLPWEIL